MFSLNAASAALLLLSSALEIAASSHLASASRHRRHARRGLPSGWTALGCMADASARILPDYHFNSDALTLESCISGCTAKGYSYAATEYAQECWCANSLTGTGQTVDSSECNAPCTGNSGQMCGGNWHASVFSNAGAGSSSTGSAAQATSTTTKVTTTAAAAAGTGSPVAAVTLSDIPTTSGEKMVVSHVILGNCYSYTQDTWKQQIQLAHASGIDAFGLNYGGDYWQASQIANAYAGASASGTGFKIYLSFDATANSCSSTADADKLRSLLNTYYNDAAQMYYNGKPFLSTFGGEGCTWGQGDVNNGWASIVKSGGGWTFVPSFFIGDPVNLKNYWVTDGDSSWDGSWSRGDYKINFDIDATHIAGNQGKVFMAAASPWFYTHYSYKNFLWYSGDFLYSSRWEQLIANRDKVNIVQVISWNDYGESHYIGPIGADQPNSQAWVNGFQHTAWLDMTAVYAKAFKAGAQPQIDADQVFLTSRAHPAGASAPDGLGKPTGWDWETTADYLWSVVFATAPATYTLRSGGTSQTFDVPAGVSKVRVPSAAGTIQGTLVRNGATVVDVAPSADEFSYTTTPSAYNYNAYVTTGKA